ncbi:hypothetical protein [Raoultibacter phocaeensis]|uniref:hypothetical protein n=1 Tax=Raoultibacter phocaeensis TaxID=2479841 RepID=UPI00111AC017|nr:hypothetical protein [Raoultibacter phocaeensis]
MLHQLKSMARPYATLFALALVVAVVARIGLAVMDVTGALSYDYISAADVPMLEVICSILTGSTLVAFMVLAGLVLVISTAGVALYGFLYERGYEGTGKPATAFLWGWATVLVALVCAFVVASGILSAVQVGSMSSKLPSPLVLAVALVVFAAFIGTLLAAASQVVCLCIAQARARGGEGLGRRLVAAAAVCGLAIMVLTVGTFASINAASIELGVVLGWFAVDIVVNLGILFGARALERRAEAVA